MINIGYDYSQFDPEAGEYNNYTPPEGDYKITLIGVQEKQNDKIGYAIEGEFLNEGDEKTYNKLFMVGHHNNQTKQIAYDTLGKIYYGITGQKPPAMGFDMSQLVNGKFSGTIVHTKNGDKTYFDIRRIMPIAGENTVTPPTAPTAPQGQQEQQTYGAPSWAKS